MFGALFFFLLCASVLVFLNDNGEPGMDTISNICI